MLDMIVGIESQFVLHRLREIAPLDRVKIFEDGFESPDDQSEHAQQNKLHPYIHDAPPRQNGIFLLHDDVHSHADEDGRGQIEQLIGHRVGRGQKNTAVVGCGVMPETNKGVGFTSHSTIRLPIQSFHLSELNCFQRAKSPHPFPRPFHIPPMSV